MLVFSSAWSLLKSRSKRPLLIRIPLTISEPLEQRLLLAGSGLSATYYDNIDFTGASATRVDPQVNFNWSTGSPDSRIGPDTFSARWTGQLQAPTTGQYTLYTYSDDGVRLTVNGQVLIDHLEPQWPTEYSTTPITLQAGQSVNIQMDFIERYGEAVAQLFWSGPGINKQIIPTSALYPSTAAPPPPSASNGLSATYYDNMDFTGSTITRTDPNVNFDWGTGSPDSHIGPDTFAAKWTGQVQVPTSGTWTFYTYSDDGVRLIVNGQTLIDHLVPQWPTEYSAPITLQAGQKYNIEVDFIERYGGAVAQLSWSGPGTAKQIVPTTALFTGAGTTPPPADTSAPSTPANFHSTDTTSSSVSLAWDASTDNVGVSSYQLLRNGVQVASLPANQLSYVDTGLAPSTTYQYQLRARDAAGNSSAYSTLSVPTAGLTSPNPTPGTGDGLRGSYFGSTDLSGTPVVRVDPGINFVWTGSPASNIPPDLFSVRWEGQVEAPVSGPFTFYTSTDDGVRLWVNGQLLVDHWQPQAETEYASAPITLSAGQKYDIKLEFYDRYGYGIARLLWAAPGLDKQVIPQQYLYSPASQPPPPSDTTPPSVPSNLRTTATTSSSLTLAWNASTDNVGVAGYELLRNGQSIATLPSNQLSYTDSGLSASTSYSYQLRASDAAGNKSGFSSLSAATSSGSTQPPPGGGNQTGQPYKGVPFSVGQRIEAEDYDLGGEGVGFHDLTPGNANGNTYRNDGPDVEVSILGGQVNGYDVGWIQAGEWLTYTVNAPAAGYYNLDAAFASIGFGGTFHVEVDGKAVSGSATIPDTGHYHRFSPVRVSAIPMSAGNHVLKIAFDSAADNGAVANLDWLQLSSGSYAPGPDLQIEAHGEPAYSGVGLFSTDPNAQMKSQSTNFLPPVYHILVTNRSNITDSFVIRTTSDNTPGWRYRIYNGDDSGPGGPAEISSLTGGQGWVIGPLAPGQSFAFRMDIVPNALAAGGSIDSVTMTATSQADPSRVDTVKPIARITANRLPEFERRNFDNSGTYLLDLTNQGNIDSSYKLSVNVNSGTTFRIFDSYWGGNDITSAVLNGTYVSPTLGHDGRQQYRVELSGSGQPSVDLHAISAQDGSQVDHVVITKAPAKPELGQFVIGVWSQPTYTFSEWQDRGINTLMRYESLGGTVSVAQWSQAARAYGFDYIRTPSPNPADDINDSHLLAWMHNDEPDINRTPVSELANNYNYWKSVDPNRLVLTNWAGSEVVGWNTGTTEQEYLNMLQYTDVGSSSVYPVSGWGQPEDLDIGGRAVERLEKWSQGQSQLAILEVGDSNVTWLPSDVRGPTGDEFRFELWDAVMHGAKGILYFPQQFYPNFSYDVVSPDVDVEMHKQDARLADLGPALMAPTDPATFGIKLPNGLEGTWRLYNGKKYFFVLNTTTQTLSGQQMQLVNTSGSSAAVEGENRSVGISNGTITDSFAPYEMHAYVVG